MTRNEAFQILKISLGEEEAEYSLQRFVALGMLKLDEVDMDEGHGKVFKIRKFMRNFHLESYSPGQLEGALAIAGLKIAEA